jgi:hypothetical protein
MGIAQVLGLWRLPRKAGVMVAEVRITIGVHRDALQKAVGHVALWYSESLDSVPFACANLGFSTHRQ